MSKRIVFFMSSMGRGGAERVVSILSKEYCERGWKVDICMLLHNMIKYDLDARVRVLDLSDDGRSKIGMLLKVRSYMSKYKPDVAVPFLSKTSALFYIATIGMRLSNSRIVVSERIDPYAVNYPKLLRKIIICSFEKADYVVFQTKRAQSYYSERIQKKSCIIGNPVTINYIKNSNPQKVIVNAGRLEEQKNQKLLIEAFSRIANKFPAYKLCIFGEGKLRVELEHLIDEKNISNQVFLMGSRADYQEQLANCEIFVLSSDYEGLSNALLEAMMIGMPCISTNCAGSDEVIIDNENGLLVPLRDVEALKNALAKLMSNPELRDRLGKEATKSTKRFNTKEIIYAWQNVLEEK